MNLRNLDKKPSSNSGGVTAFAYFAPEANIISSGKPTDTTILVVDNTFADIATRNASSPTSGDTCYVTSEGIHYEYITSGWKRASPVINNHSFGFDSGKGFFKIATTQDKAGFEFEVPTEDDVTGKYLKPIFAVPGHGVDQLEFERLVTTTPGVLIIITNDGEKLQFGSVENPVTIKTKELNQGQKAMDYKGIVYEATASQSSIIHYTGDLVEND
jgi:hypothetical protein